MLDRASLSGFTAALLEDGPDPPARSRHLAVRRCSARLAEEGKILSDPLLDVRSPKVDIRSSTPLDDDEFKLLIKARQGKDLRDPRDETIIRLSPDAPKRFAA